MPSFTFESYLGYEDLGILLAEQADPAGIDTMLGAMFSAMREADADLLGETLDYVLDTVLAQKTCKKGAKNED